MAEILPQQELLLQLLVMSGDIGIAADIRDTILERTLEECRRAGWVSVNHFGAGFNKASITPDGRALIKEILARSPQRRSV